MGLCALAVSALATGPHLDAQQVIYEPGDLLMGFRATSGTGSEQTILFNLGSSVAFRDNPDQGIVFNLNSLLSATYGLNWFDRADLHFGVAGVRDNRNPLPPIGARPPVVDGDPSATVYISRAAASPGTSLPWAGYVRAGLVSGAGLIRGMADLGQAAQGCFIFQSPAPGTDNRGAVIAASLQNSWAFYNPMPGAGFDIFTGGVQNAFGVEGDAAYVDVYRMLATTEGADPGGEVGVGTLVGTFAVDRQGNIIALGLPGEEPDIPFWDERDDLVSFGVDNWYYFPWLGFFYGTQESGDYIYVPSAESWSYWVPGESEDDFFFYQFSTEEWFWTGVEVGLWVYQSSPSAGWQRLID